MQKEGIIKMNARGMHLLRSGQSMEAAAVYRTALKALLEGYVRETENEDDDDIDCNPITHEIRAVEVPDNGPSFRKAADHNSFCFFNKALVSDAEDDDELQGARNQNLMSTVLLFNLGLCFHVAAVNQGIDQQLNLRKALKLYTMAVDVMTAERSTFECPLVSLAIANNMGSIYANFFEADAVQRCLSWIRAIFEDTCPMYFMESEDYSLFHLNVILMDGYEVHVAAAA